jgi:hypothetical protein
MFRITRDPLSGCDNLYLTEIACNGSNVLVMCVVGAWRHILDLWCVCAVRRPEPTQRTHTHTHTHTQTHTPQMH